MPAPMPVPMGHIGKSAFAQNSKQQSITVKDRKLQGWTLFTMTLMFKYEIDPQSSTENSSEPQDSKRVIQESKKFILYYVSTYNSLLGSFKNLNAPFSPEIYLFIVMVFMSRAKAHVSTTELANSVGLRVARSHFWAFPLSAVIGIQIPSSALFVQSYVLVQGLRHCSTQKSWRRYGFHRSKKKGGGPSEISRCSSPPERSRFWRLYVSM